MKVGRKEIKIVFEAYIARNNVPYGMDGSHLKVHVVDLQAEKIVKTCEHEHNAPGEEINRCADDLLQQVRAAN